MKIKFVRDVVVTDSQGNSHAFGRETILTVTELFRVVGGVALTMDGIDLWVGNEPFAILMGEPEPVVPEYIPCQPYKEMGDYTVRYYRDGIYYDADELPAKFLIAK